MNRRPGAALPALAAVLFFSALRLNARETGAAFLTLGQGARAQGMSGAFTALADDGTALFWNPAGLARSPDRELSAGHAALAGGVETDFLGYVQPARWGGVGAAALRLSPGALEGRDENRAVTGDFRAEDLSAGFGAARRLGGALSAGLGLRWVRQRIADASAQGPALDAGLLAGTPLPALQVGAALRNLGPALRFGGESMSLPLTAAAGAAWRGSLFTLSLEGRYAVHERRARAALGMEVSPTPVLTLRAGYLSPAGRAASLRGGRDGLAGLAGGLGVRLRRTRLDYAFSPAGERGNLQQMGLSFQF